MKAADKAKSFLARHKRRAWAASLFTCLMLTFLAPAAGGGYAILKDPPIKAGAASVDAVDLPLVGASAFAEARKSMNSSDPDAKDQFITNMVALIGGDSGYRWQNLGLLLGPKDALSGTAWNTFLSPITMSQSEIENYGNPALGTAYKKYKTFGSAVESLNAYAKMKRSSSSSITEGLDSMSRAALRLGNFGVKFLEKYNPAPVVLAFYDSSNLSTYSNNKLVEIVNGNQIMKQIICLFGDKVANTGLSFFVIINSVVAIILFALSLFLTLMGSQGIGDSLRKFLTRVVIGTLGIYAIGNLMSVMLKHVGETVLSMDAWEEVSYVENNLNLYDWYLTGFSLPSGTQLKINKKDQFVFDTATTRAINQYTYKRLTGEEGTDADIKERMEKYTENGNSGTASFITPTYVSTSDEDGTAGEAWATDIYYAVMDNFANNADLMEGADSESSPLNRYAERGFTLSMSRYLNMSSLNMFENSDGSGWTASMFAVVLPGASPDNYYGLNPISAFNILRTGFRGNNIAPVSTVSPKIAYVAYDITRLGGTRSESRNMNSILRFIATFSIIMAAMKGMINIFAAGFGGMISGGVKTATGSAHGLGQAIGAVLAIFGGLIGISLILSVDMTLLDELYGIAYDLIHSNDILDSILAPIEDAVGDIPFIGELIMDACRGIAGFILTLIFSLTFPKLGAIPINTFCQMMADLPGRIGEKAQMIEAQLMSGRVGGGGGLGRGGGGGGYGKMMAAQASQAMSSGQRQAGAVLAGLGGAAAAIGGAGLSKIGKSLNNHADKSEGKPKNPGMDGWDSLTPEQQTAAAAAAADAGKDWDDMDQDARQKAMEDRMEADQARAQEASGEDTQRNEDALADERMAAMESSEDGAGGADGEDALDGADGASQEAMDGMDGTEQAAESLADSIEDAADAQADMASDAMEGSIGDAQEGYDTSEDATDGSFTDDPAEQAAQNASEHAGEGSLNGADAGQGGISDLDMDSDVTAINEAGDISEDSTMNIGGEDGMEAPEEPAGMDAEDALGAQEATEGLPDGDGQPLDGNSINYDSKQESLHAEQKVGNNVNANADVKNVDNSSLSDEGGHGPDGPSEPGKDPVQGPDGKGSLAASAAGGTDAKGMGPDGKPPVSGNVSVNAPNSQTASMTNSQMAKVQASQINKANATNINSMAAGKDGAQGASARRAGTGATSARPGTSTRPNASRAAQAGTGRGSMSSGQGAQKPAPGGTSKSQWDKDMSIGDQRKARIMHAMGDGLQMAGGNRTLGDGFKDAMGHMKDAAAAYAVPEEYAGQMLVDSIRSKRIQRNVMRKNEREKNNGQKK